MSSHSDSPGTRARRLVLYTGCCFASLWLIGAIASDRWLISQWCSWIPAITLLPVGAFLAWYSRNRSSRITWLAIGILGTCWWFFVDEPWRMHAGRHDGLALVQWTMSHDKTDRDAHANVIVELDADITVLTHGYGVRGTDLVLDWLGPDVLPYKYGHFTILTRLPVRRLKSIASSQDIHLQFIEIDTTSRLGRPLHIIAVDLPSDPFRSRMDIAETARGWIEERKAPVPDLALGDFNMTRSSAALRRLFPALHDAWSRGGRGWGPTFPRVLPLYHIDHVLVADWLKVESSRTMDPGIGRHRLQLIHLERKSD